MLAPARGETKNSRYASKLDKLALGIWRVRTHLGHRADHPYHPRMPLLRYVVLTRSPHRGNGCCAHRTLDNRCTSAIHNAEWSTRGRQLRITRVFVMSSTVASSMCMRASSTVTASPCPPSIGWAMAWICKAERGLIPPPYNEGWMGGSGVNCGVVSLGEYGAQVRNCRIPSDREVVSLDRRKGLSEAEWRLVSGGMPGRW